MQRRSPLVVAGLAVAVLATAAAVLQASPGAASTGYAAGCTLWSERPEWVNATILGRGSWYNCPSGTGVTVVLRHDRSWWPDGTLASRSGNGSSGSLLTSYPCGTDFDPIKVFVETQAAGRKVQSERAILPCG
ncbi:MAG: hypothetical protein ACRDKW_17130 [Actinomycetota bacterium]